MYDDLVKRLRDAAKMSEALSVLLPHSEGNATAKLYNEAADAVEELNKQIENGHKAYKAVYHNLAARIPHWISVKDRLPEEPYGCLLVVWDSPQNGGDDFLNYLPYFAGWDGEQWNDADGEQVPFEVVYWRPLPPLPKGPKEET